jgi:phage head maturation protease
MPDTAIKVLDETPESFTLGGYGIVFGGKDLVGDHFDAGTDVWADRLVGVPILYEHGLREPARTILGKVARARMDDLGWWVEAEIRRNADYASGVLELAKAGALGWSTGAVSHLVEREASGRLKSWPVAELSCTPVPAEPRTLGVTVMKVLDDETEPVAWLEAGHPDLALTSGIPAFRETKHRARLTLTQQRRLLEILTEAMGELGPGQDPDPPPDPKGRTWKATPRTLPEEGADIAGALSRYADRLKAADTAALAEALKVLESLHHVLARAAPELAIARRRAVPPDDLIALRADFDAFARRTAHIAPQGKENTHAR